MEIEYLEYECEVIDLDDTTAHSRNARAEEAAAEAVFASWFTDWRSRSAPEAISSAGKTLRGRSPKRPLLQGESAE